MGKSRKAFSEEEQAGRVGKKATLRVMLVTEPDSVTLLKRYSETEMLFTDFWLLD